jgi:phospholipase/lecithinase/hemolysin
MMQNAGSTIPLSKQVQYFNATRSKMIAAAAGSSDAVDTQINKSVFLILIGGNDLFAFANAEQAQNRSGADLQSDVTAFYGSLISNYSAAVRDLYALGARRLAVINVGLAGCLPVARVLDATGACAEDRNRLAAGFNAALRSLLADLASSSSGLPGLAYSLADNLGLMADTFAHPRVSGFTDVADACCGGGRLGAEAACAPNATLCADRGQYYFWDNIHPTERAAALRAQAFYDGPARYTTPINFKQLVHMS